MPPPVLCAARLRPSYRHPRRHARSAKGGRVGCIDTPQVIVLACIHACRHISLGVIRWRGVCCHSSSQDGSDAILAQASSAASPRPAPDLLRLQYRPVGRSGCRCPRQPPLLLKLYFALCLSRPSSVSHQVAVWTQPLKKWQGSPLSTKSALGRAWRLKSSHKSSMG